MSTRGSTWNTRVGEFGSRLDAEIRRQSARSLNVAVDFETATEEARALINAWVEGQTNDRIVDLAEDE